MPRIKGCPQELKTNGSSVFWIQGEGMVIDDIVKIWATHQPGSGEPDEVLWEGEVKQVRGDMVRCKVSYVGSRKPGVGDLEMVDVTVTHETDTSPAVRIDVLVDGP